MNADEPGSESISTDSEIKRERAAWVAKYQAKHLEFVKRLPPFHTSRTFMDYLHGGVKEVEQWCACHYEYARESEAMWKAAKDRDALKQANPLVPCEGVVLKVAGQHPGNWWAGNSQLLKFLICQSFPGKDWNELSEAERNAIMDGTPRTKTPPLPMTDVWTLKAMLNAEPWSDKFRALIDKSTPVAENIPPGRKALPVTCVWPVLQKWKSNHWAVFDLDFSKSETELVNEFKEWLKLPEQTTMLEKYKRPKKGTTGQPLDRLKDLASWRLYRELNNDLEGANKFARKNRRQRKPFRDAKEKKETGVNGIVLVIPANEADLFGDDAEARDAKATAWKYMVDIMPAEFAPPGPPMLRMFSELRKAMG